MKSKPYIAGIVYVCMETESLDKKIKMLSLRLSICAKDLNEIQRELYDIMEKVGELKK